MLGYVCFSHGMNSQSLALWLAGPTFEIVILLRALVIGWVRTCPFFFGYLANVFFQDIFFLAVYIFKFKYYAPTYWYGEFFSLLLGCAVTWEIFRLVLGPYPGCRTNGPKRAPICTHNDLIQRTSWNVER